MAALGSLLARPWAAPGLSGAVLAASWASFGASWAALGRRKRFSRNLVKTVVFACYLRGFGPSGPLLAALGWLLGRPKWSWVALGWLLGRPKWSWVALGPSEVVLGGFWVALVSSLGGPGVAAPAKAPRPRTCSLYRLGISCCISILRKAETFIILEASGLPKAETFTIFHSPMFAKRLQKSSKRPASE